MTWDTADLDLAAYLERTGAAAEPPSAAALARLQTAHVRTFPFENIDVLLEQHPGVGLSAVQDKFVHRHRGGYCFEHATIFHAVLVRLGYDVEPRLARVANPQTSPRSHLVMIVTLDGRRHLSDPGIGIAPLEPIELADGAELSGGLWPHQVRRTDAEQPGGHAWELWRRRGDDWEYMHTTDELPVRRVDVEMGHHWTSTAPSSHFRSSLSINRNGVDADGTPNLLTVTLDYVALSRAGEAPQRRDYDPAELPELPELAQQAGARLSAAESELLVDRIRELRHG
ncbi:arylamine N-acetyltransferase family protein [Microlunatus speluncae]|uniref:arylamine N-acetyltransferase family protein n=1 Tax=Microlunatus speluncae TaxID=2594267 RepID=UPI0012662ABC|nr:arylamine N-acetyltransferase [Microlunatus speluncae]